MKALSTLACLAIKAAVARKEGPTHDSKLGLILSSGIRVFISSTRF